MGRFVNDLKNNESFARYFVEQSNNYQLPKGFEIVDVDFCDLILFLHNGNKDIYTKYKQWVAESDPKTTYIFVVDRYDGIKDPSLLPKKCIIFTSNEGCNHYFTDKNKKVVSIPLLNKPAKDIDFIPILDRGCQFSFVGKPNNSIRRELLKLEGGYVSSEHISQDDYCNIISKSVFTLCPRGINWSSYRICEALRYGSIPVYISDNFIIPEGFETYGIIVNETDIKKTPAILYKIRNEKINELISAGQEYYDKMFTYEGLAKWIIDKIKELK